MVIGASVRAILGSVVAKWTCAKDGDEATCTCEGLDAHCKSTLAGPRTVKRSLGTVLWLNDSKGFGFIVRDEGG